MFSYKAFPERRVGKSVCSRDVVTLVIGPGVGWSKYHRGQSTTLGFSIPIHHSEAKVSVYLCRVHELEGIVPPWAGIVPHRV